MSLEQLLVVQEHDSAIDRLRHSRENLPEFAALAQLDDEQAHLDAARAELAEQRHQVGREQKRLEDEAALITERIDKDTTRLYDGSVTAHKDLQAMQDEIATLKHRRSGLEDGILEAMETGEPLDEQLAEFDAKLADVERRRAQVQESLEQAQADIDDRVEFETAARGEAAAPVDAALLQQYEQTRDRSAGVGVVRLVQKTCQGCHLTLSAVEYDRVRKEPSDALVRCGECNRILVR